MERMTDAYGRGVRDDPRVKRTPGESQGKWHVSTYEWRKIWNDNSGTMYWFSSNGEVYHPLTQAQAEIRGLDTFSY
jgi:hypothetical protein